MNFYDNRETWIDSKENEIFMEKSFFSAGVSVDGDAERETGGERRPARLGWSPAG